MSRDEPTPFPLLFLEPMPPSGTIGPYDETTQRASSADALAGTRTTEETATGGWGDTDTDSDTD